jgi:hypothetical protein
MSESYETYCAHCRAQEVRPASRKNWEADTLRAQPHVVEFYVTAEMAKHGTLPEGWHRNHFGRNHKLLKTERIQ